MDQKTEKVASLNESPQSSSGLVILWKRKLRKLLGSNQTWFQISFPYPIASIGVRMKTATQESLHLTDGLTR